MIMSFIYMHVRDSTSLQFYIFLFRTKLMKKQGKTKNNNIDIHVETQLDDDSSLKSRNINF